MRAPQRPTPARSRSAWRIAASTLLGSSLMLTACGNDDSDEATEEAIAGASEGTGAPSDDTTSSTGAPPADGVVEVELADFSFEGLPASVAAGTRLTVTNSSEVELHKLSALPLPADEDRPVEELVSMPGAELAAILRVRPATVLVAGPGGPQVEEVGDGTLSAPGRYLLICAVPLGLDPDEYLDALPGNGRRPQVSGQGAPHFRLGMVADLIVEAP